MSSVTFLKKINFIRSLEKRKVTDFSVFYQCMTDNDMNFEDKNKLFKEPLEFFKISVSKVTFVRDNFKFPTDTIFSNSQQSPPLSLPEPSHFQKLPHDALEAFLISDSRVATREVLQWSRIVCAHRGQNEQMRANWAWETETFARFVSILGMGDMAWFKYTFPVMVVPVMALKRKSDETLLSLHYFCALIVTQIPAASARLSTPSRRRHLPWRDGRAV